MKLSFRKDPPPQSQPQQHTTARHSIQSSWPRPQISLPNTWVLLTLGLVTSLVVGGYFWWKNSHIDTLGLVTTYTDHYIAPVRSRITSIPVRNGDLVTTGDTLFYLSSDEARHTLQKSKIVLQQKQLDLTAAITLRNRHTISVEAIANKKAAFAEQTAHIAHQRQNIILAHKTTLQPLTNNLALAEKKLAHQHSVSEQLTTAEDDTLLLKHLDAASAQDAIRMNEKRQQQQLIIETLHTDIANTTHAIAQHKEQTRIQLEQLTAEETTLQDQQKRMEQTLDAEQELTLAQDETTIARLRSEIENLKKDIRHLTEQAGPHRYTARATGIIVGVNGTDGAMIAQDDTIISIAQTEQLWVNAFIRPEDRSLLLNHESITIVPSAGGQSFAGHITTPGGIEESVPESIRDLNPDLTHALHVHIDVSKRKELIPGDRVRVIIR